MGTGFDHIPHQGDHEALAGDAVLWSGSDGGRCSIVGKPSDFTVVMVYNIVLVLSSYVIFYSLCGPD